MPGFRGPGAGIQHGGSSFGQSNIEVVQRDWDDRDFTHTIQHGVAQLVSFLNDFGARARTCSRPAPVARARALPPFRPTAPRARRRHYPWEAGEHQQQARKAREEVGDGGGDAAVGRPGDLGSAGTRRRGPAACVSPYVYKWHSNSLQRIRAATVIYLVSGDHAPARHTQTRAR